MRSCRTIVLGCLLLAIKLSAALPTPPAQDTAWKLSPGGDAVPGYVVKVTATLFAAGLADPRGGAYREVELPMAIGDKNSLKTHAWAFPEGYAVCWNGLVYRVRTVGPFADLDKDVNKILNAHPWSARTLGRSVDDHDPERAAFWYSRSGQTLAPTSIALLLRLGRSDLAAKFWKAPEGGAVDCFGCVSQHEADETSWLVTSTRVWLGTGYWRLIGAFQRRDFKGAIDVAESLLLWQSRVPESWRE